MKTTRKPTAAALHVQTARQVQAAGAGDLADGGGLILRITVSSANWVFRYTSPSGKRREMGLGVAHRASVALAGTSLAGARESAQAARELLRRGVDPIDDRDARRDAAQQAEKGRKASEARERRTLARVARDYHAKVIEPTRTDKHGADWIASLENHLPASVWHAPIDIVGAPALLTALSEIKPHERNRRAVADKAPAETVQRIRQRLDAIFEDAIFHGYCTSNPAAACRRKLAEVLGRRKRGHLLALPYKEAPSLVQRIRQCEGTAARCLEFALLTVARTSEALLCQWSEFDLETGIWTVPAERMKSREAHTVCLSPRAVEILSAQVGQDVRYVFPSSQPGRAGKPQSNMTMLAVLDRLGMRDQTTVHGLARATFSTWANETGAARPDVIEACLAHNESNKVRASYNHAKFNDERRALLVAWADYLARPLALVIPIGGQAA